MVVFVAVWVVMEDKDNVDGDQNIQQNKCFVQDFCIFFKHENLISLNVRSQHNLFFRPELLVSQVNDVSLKVLLFLVNLKLL